MRLTVVLLLIQLIMLGIQLKILLVVVAGKEPPGVCMLHQHIHHVALPPLKVLLNYRIPVWNLRF
jgi:hypothetical protein